MAQELSSDLQKQVKDHQEDSENENVEGIDSPEGQRTIDDDENIR